MFKDLFDYDGKNLIWKNPPSSRFSKGQIAGTKHKRGYIQVCFLGELHLAHRIVWEMNNGSIPEGMQIDHINQDKSDNSISNLRLVSQSENKKNKPKQLSNTSGVNGVSWNKSKGKWQVRIGVCGKDVHIGYFLDIEYAERARAEADFNFNFHENHGNKKRQ